MSDILLSSSALRVSRSSFDAKMVLLRQLSGLHALALGLIVNFYHVFWET